MEKVLQNNDESEQIFRRPLIILHIVVRFLDIMCHDDDTTDFHNKR